MTRLNRQRFERLAEFCQSPAAEQAGLVASCTLIPDGRYVRTWPEYMDFTTADPICEAQAREQRATTEQKYGTISLGIFKNAKVIGPGALITSNNILIEESCIEHLVGKIPIPNLTINQDYIEFSDHLPTRKLNKAALLVKRPSSRNYGHWLVESATALAILKNYIKENELALIIDSTPNVDQGMGRVVFDTLRILCPDAEVIQHDSNDVFEVETLHYLTPLHNPPSTKVPQGLDRLRTFFLQAVGSAVEGQNKLSDVPKPRRIYLSRADQATRRIQNENEVVCLLSSFGFERTFVSDMSLIEQIALFNESEFVIGVKGAALTNLLFADRCRAMVLSPRNWPDPFFFDICTQLRIPYGEMFCDVIPGTTEGHEDLIVDIDRLTKLVKIMTGL